MKREKTAPKQKRYGRRVSPAMASHGSGSATELVSETAAAQRKATHTTDYVYGAMVM